MPRTLLQKLEGPAHRRPASWPFKEGSHAERYDICSPVSLAFMGLLYRGPMALSTTAA